MHVFQYGNWTKVLRKFVISKESELFFSDLFTRLVYFTAFRKEKMSC